MQDLKQQIDVMALKFTSIMDNIDKLGKLVKLGNTTMEIKVDEKVYSSLIAKMNKKLRSTDNLKDIIEDVKDSPSYFLMQGGSDGTFGHIKWYGTYGHLLPEITDLASLYGGEV